MGSAWAGPANLGGTLEKHTGCSRCPPKTTKCALAAPCRRQRSTPAAETQHTMAQHPLRICANAQRHEYQPHHRALRHVPATNHFAAAPRLDAQPQDRFGGTYVVIFFTSDVGYEQFSCAVRRRGPLVTRRLMARSASGSRCRRLSPEVELHDCLAHIERNSAVPCTSGVL